MPVIFRDFLLLDLTMSNAFYACENHERNRNYVLPTDYGENVEHKNPSPSIRFIRVELKDICEKLSTMSSAIAMMLAFITYIISEIINDILQNALLLVRHGNIKMLKIIIIYEFAYFLLTE